MKYPQVRTSLLILIILSAGLYIFQTWLSGGYAVLQMVFATLLISLFAAGTMYLIRYIFGHKPYIFPQLPLYVFLWISALYSTLHLFLFVFAYFENNLAPASLGKIHISNGEKHVIFQQMSHIATPEFFGRVKKDIETYSENGYRIFYEGVGTGSAESEKILNTALGIELHSGTYASIASVIGLEEQNYRDLFAGIEDTSRLENVDLSLDDLGRLYTARAESGTTKTNSVPPVDITRELSGVTMRPNEKLAISYLARGFLNYMLKLDSALILSDMAMFADKDILPIILDERNRVIADAIRNSDTPSIYALYGALHFEGVLSYLVKQDPKWKILSVESIRPY